VWLYALPCHADKGRPGSNLLGRTSHFDRRDIGIAIALPTPKLISSLLQIQGEPMRRIQTLVLCALALMMLVGSPQNAAAQAIDPFLGQIMFAGFNFAPRGWAECNGQLLSIAQNTALFALLGTQYGGNGQTTFALPDMRGRMLIHAGQGPGLTPREQGEASGQEQVTLNQAQMPVHTHPLVGASTEASSSSPAGNLPATKARVTLYTSGPAPADSPMSPLAIGTAGNSVPHDNMPPYLTVRCFIALVGVFPSRN
jgi:microcystin-dependent protein